jgi:hypothetical protein
MKRNDPPSQGQATIRDLAVVGWRRKQLLAAGFGLAEADELARNCAIDLHSLTGLVERGCPPRLAARIVAPLGPDRRLC